MGYGWVLKPVPRVVPQVLSKAARPPKNHDAGDSHFTDGKKASPPNYISLVPSYSVFPPSAGAAAASGRADEIGAFDSMNLIS